MPENHSTSRIAVVKKSLTRKYFTADHGYKRANYRMSEIELKREDGSTAVAKRKVSVPEHWSDRAALIAASKYFTDKEGGVDRMLARVVSAITSFGRDSGYFETHEEADIFAEELWHILESQRAAFNSPVWFNVGVQPKPQCSACFILNVNDNMESILTWYRDEGRIFCSGSGAGINLSKLRSKYERLSGRGFSSGPLSFMRAADASAGVIKSGGKTRRAAKMVVMDYDHPEIFDFIECKVDAENMIRALINAGFSGGIDGDARMNAPFQNANNSIRVTDDFMRRVMEDRDFTTKLVTTYAIHETYAAKPTFRKISEAAWKCGDPGLQFDDEIQRMHTNPQAGRINASNPCSEYFHLDNTACNLASIKLTKFLCEDGDFMINDFIHTVEVMITAQDILVDMAGYPTEEITSNAHKYRELGLGYADLGAAIMRQGFAYNSELGRSFASAVTALMTGAAYRQSSRIGQRLGCAEGLEPTAMQAVLINHLTALETVAARSRQLGNLRGFTGFEDIADAADTAWRDAIVHYRDIRNTQATVIAPTGTIALMMDCDTTGGEPPIALTATKELVGGGTMSFVNQSVGPALRKIGYEDQDIERVVEYIKQNGTIEGGIAESLLPIFDCAFKPANGVRTISPEGHIRMCAAIQPFISGGISKTVNLPASATIEDVEEMYLLAWRLKLKSVSVYRDGCKAIQVLSVSGNKPEEVIRVAPTLEPRPVRYRLPDLRQSITQHFNIAGHKGYITVGKYPDGAPGEIFDLNVKTRKHGRGVCQRLCYGAELLSAIRRAAGVHHSQVQAFLFRASWVHPPRSY